MKRYTYRVTSILTMLVLLAFVALAASAEDQLVVKKEKPSGWLGVQIQDISPKLAKQKELKNEEGAFVTDVVDESPADSAGLKKGDVITKFGDRPIDDADDLVKAVKKSAPGSKIKMEFTRKGEKKVVDVVLKKMPKKKIVRKFSFPQLPHLMIGKHLGLAGMSFIELNEQLGKYFEAPGGKGVLVDEVKPESPGAKAGIQAGDVIVSANKEEIEDIDDIRQVIDDADEDATIEIVLLRKGAKKTVTLKVEKDDESMFEFNMQSPGHGNNFFFRTLPDEKELELELLQEGCSGPGAIMLRGHRNCPCGKDREIIHEEQGQARKELEKTIQISVGRKAITL